MMEIPLEENKTIIDINTEEYAFLRKPVYDFQYINFESSSSITVYKLENNNDSYVIVGIKKKQKVRLMPC